MGVLGELLSELKSWKASAAVPRRVLLAQARNGDKEVPDLTPVALPIGYDRPSTMEEMVQKYVRQEVSAQAQDMGYGSFQEEDDFEPEDPSELPLTGYEVTEFAMEDEQVPETPKTEAEAPEPAEAVSAPAEPPPAEAKTPQATPQ